MAVSHLRVRTWTPGGIPFRFLLLGLAAAVGLARSYVAIAGNPLTRNQQTTTYQTAAGHPGHVAGHGGRDRPDYQSRRACRLSFKSSGKLAEVDVAVGQQVTAGQTLARLDTTDLQIARRPGAGRLDTAAGQPGDGRAPARRPNRAAARAGADRRRADQRSTTRRRACRRPRPARPRRIAGARPTSLSSQVALRPRQKRSQSAQDQAPPHCRPTRRR